MTTKICNQYAGLMTIAALLLLCCSLSAAEPAPSRDKQLEFFELHIRPVLIEKCADCHTGGADAESPLALQSRADLLKGGDFGPTIVPGNPQASLLFQSIQRTHKELKMPPDAADRLNAETRGHFKRWIAWGAPWPEEKTKARTAPGTKSAEKLTTSHWCFLPRKQVTPPEIDDSH